MYKDDLEAAHQRIQALEDQLRRLRRGREEARLPPPPRSSSDRAAALLLLVLLLAGLVAAAALAVRRPPWGTPVALLLLVVAGLLPVWLHRRVIARPCEWLVRRRGGGGTRVVPSGRAIRPLRGELFRLGRQPWPLQWGVEAPLQEGGTVALQGTAWLAVSDDTKRAPRALGMEPAAARSAIEQTLASWINGREAMDSSCPEVTRLAQPLVTEAAEKLGLQLLYHGVDGVKVR
jgi:hypothetical protein